MPAANVRTYERNYTSRAQGQTGVYNSIVIPAKKGPINTPILISSEKDLLDIFTPKKTIGIGYNMAYYSALAVLQKTDKLWVTRVANGAEQGGVLINNGVGYSQVNELTPELPLITFDVSNITDGSANITISNVVGGVEADLVGRVINIVGVNGSFTINSITASVATLNTPITSTISFTGTGIGTVNQSIDYLGFDVNFGIGNSTTVDVSNLTSGLPSDLNGAQISLVADGVKFTRNVISVLGSTLTLDVATPSVINALGTGYRGTPSVTATVSGIIDGGNSIQLSNISPIYLTTTDINGSTLNVVADMSDNSTVTISSIVDTPSGSTMNFVDGFNNPALIDVSTGEAPFTDATASGITDINAINQTTSLFALVSSDGGVWCQDLRIEILTGKEVKELDAFIINVYDKANLIQPLESFTVSRVEGRKDGFGRNMFIDSVLENSRLIRGINNILVDPTILPQETVTRDVNGNITSRTFMKFVAGSDGNAVTDSDMITSLDLMNNKNSYPVTLFLDGGWSTPAYQRRIAEICQLRDDSVAILSVPYEKEISATYAKDIVDYRNIQLNLFSTFASLYSCHVKITDKYNDRQIFVSPDGYAAAAINESKANYEIWYPSAGYKRGKLFVNDTLLKFTDGELDYLSENSINPIRYAPGKGISIWGQYTLGLTPSALDRLNVRLLVNEIKPAISTLLESYLFELNSLSVRQQVKIQIESYLTNIQSRNGIYNFKVVCDDTNNSAADIDNHVLNVDVFIKPTQSIEYINFTTILSSTGIEFEKLI